MKYTPLFISIFLILGITGAFLVKPIRAGSPDQDNPIVVEVNLKEYTVNSSRTSLPVGVPIRFVVTNNGAVTHEVVLEKAGVDDEPLEIGGEESEIEDINPGETKSAMWVISEPGQYQLACHIPGHYEGGMAVMFSVDPPGLAGLIGQPLFWIVVSGLALLIAIAISVAIVNRSKQRNTASI